MNNIISFDTEFNLEKEPLSFGYYKDGISKEMFFNNQVDNRTFKIHGISQEFINKNGIPYFKYKNNIVKLFKDSDYIAGFDLSSDFKVLSIPSFEYYFKQKCIDLKVILTLMDIHFSLEDIKNILRLDDLKSHSAKNDSIVVNHLINFFIEDLSESNKSIILNIFAEISLAYENKQSEEKSRLKHELHSLLSHKFQELKKVTY